MDLKQVLGEKYRDDMTAEEIAAALQGYNPTEGMYTKQQFDKVMKEAAENKRQMRENEQKSTDAETRIAELEKRILFSDMQNEYLGLGWSAELAAAQAKAIVDGDRKAQIDNQRKYAEHLEQTLREKLMQEAPKPPVGSVATSVDYSAQIADANARGDMTAVASLMRLQQQQQNE